MSSEVETRLRAQREAAREDASTSLGNIPRLRLGRMVEDLAIGSAGTLLGIARHDRPRGAMETVELVDVGVETGLHGDYRGSLKPGRNKRQVTVMSLAAWRAALAEVKQPVAWEQRRVNLLVDGLELEQTTGMRIVFSGGVVLEVTGECDPCSRMEEVSPGLKAALLPHWRGGVTTKVAQAGRIAVGDTVRIEGVRIER